MVKCETNKVLQIDSEINNLSHSIPPPPPPQKKTLTLVMGVFWRVFQIITHRILTITKQGSILDVRICRYQILTFKVDPCTERITYL